jgi:hypothetical protein
MADLDDVTTGFAPSITGACGLRPNTSIWLLCAQGIVDYRIVRRQRHRGRARDRRRQMIVDITTTGATLAANG